MTGADLLRLEAERRARWRAAVLADFEVTSSNQDRVRRREVMRAVAARLGIPVGDSPLFQKRLIREVLALGAEAIKPRNKRYYRKLRRKSGPSAP